METIRFDLRDAQTNGFGDHPQRVMNQLGSKVLKYEGIEIADCIMMQVDKLPEPIPVFIRLSDYKFD